MAVAHMPRQTNHIRARDAQQRLFGGRDFNIPAVVQFKRIAMVQRHGLGQIHQKGQTVLGRQLLAARRKRSV